MSSHAKILIVSQNNTPGLSNEAQRHADWTPNLGSTNRRKHSPV